MNHHHHQEEGLKMDATTLLASSNNNNKRKRQRTNDENNNNENSCSNIESRNLLSFSQTTTTTTTTAQNDTKKDNNNFESIVNFSSICNEIDSGTDSFHQAMRAQQHSLKQLELQTKQEIIKLTQTLQTIQAKIIHVSNITKMVNQTFTTCNNSSDYNEINNVNQERRSLLGSQQQQQQQQQLHTPPTMTIPQQVPNNPHNNDNNNNTTPILDNGEGKQSKASAVQLTECNNDAMANNNEFHASSSIIIDKKENDSIEAIAVTPEIIRQGVNNKNYNDENVKIINHLAKPNRDKLDESLEDDMDEPSKIQFDYNNENDKNKAKSPSSSSSIPTVQPPIILTVPDSFSFPPLVLATLNKMQAKLSDNQTAFIKLKAVVKSWVVQKASLSLSSNNKNSVKLDPIFFPTSSYSDKVKHAVAISLAKILVDLGIHKEYNYVYRHWRTKYSMTEAFQVAKQGVLFIDCLKGQNERSELEDYLCQHDIINNDNTLLVYTETQIGLRLLKKGNLDLFYQIQRWKILDLDRLPLLLSNFTQEFEYLVKQDGFEVGKITLDFVDELYCKNAIYSVVPFRGNVPPSTCNLIEVETFWEFVKFCWWQRKFESPETARKSISLGDIALGSLNATYMLSVQHQWLLIR